MLADFGLEVATVRQRGDCLICPRLNCSAPEIVSFTALGEGAGATIDNGFVRCRITFMNVEQLLELTHAQPFEPFCLVMANGERLLVPHEDFIWVMPNRRVVQVALPNGASRWVNLQLVAGLEKPLS